MSLLHTDAPPSVYARSCIISDADLVRQVLAGRADCFAQLVERYQRAVVATARRVLRDRHSAEDAAQDAFVIAYQNLPRLRDPCAFGAWLLKIARQQAGRHARARRRHQQPIERTREQPVGDPNTESLLHAVARLPDHERVIILLRHFEGHDVSGIAAITGRPVGTVTKQLSRAHQRLRGILEEQP